MLSNKQNKLIEDITIKIYESIYNQAVKESQSNTKTDDSILTDLEEKVDIILDALGLEYNKKDDEEVVEKDTNITIEKDDNDNVPLSRTPRRPLPKLDKETEETITEKEEEI